MTPEERLAFVDAMRERGAIVVEVDGARVTFPEPARAPANTVAEPIPTADGNGTPTPMTPEEEGIERDRMMLWSAD